MSLSPRVSQWKKVFLGPMASCDVVIPLFGHYKNDLPWGLGMKRWIEEERQGLLAKGMKGGRLEVGNDEKGEYSILNMNKKELQFFL